MFLSLVICSNGNKSANQSLNHTLHYDYIILHVLFYYFIIVQSNC